MLPASYGQCHQGRLASNGFVDWCAEYPVCGCSVFFQSHRHLNCYLKQMVLPMVKRGPQLEMIYSKIPDVAHVALRHGKGTKSLPSTKKSIDVADIYISKSPSL